MLHNISDNNFTLLFFYLFKSNKTLNAIIYSSYHKQRKLHYLISIVEQKWNNSISSGKIPQIILITSLYLLIKVFLKK